MGGRALNSITAMQTTPGGERCAAWIRGAPPTPRRVRKVTQELRRKDLTSQSVGAEGWGEEEGREDWEEGTACVRALRQK